MATPKDKPFIDDERKTKGIGRALENNKKISRKNKDAVMRFIDYKTASGRCERRTSKLTSNLNTILTRFTDKNFDLEGADIEELMPLITRIEASDFSPATKADFKGIIKQIYRFFQVEIDRKTAKEGKTTYYDKMTQYPGKVMFFDTTIKQAKRKQPEDMITRPELEKLTAACRNPRDEAIMQMLYESGARIGEFGELRIKHVAFNEDGYKLHITQGKTGPRTLQQIESERYVRAWLDKHPDRENPDAFLWVHVGETRGERMDYDTIRMMLRKKAKRAGVNPDKVNPHNFRHTRATELAGKLTEAQMCLYFGWVMGSKMVRVYVHMSGRDLDEAYRRIHGLKGEKDEVTAVRCPTCRRENPPGATYCNRCSRPLNTKAAIDAEKKDKTLDMVLDMILHDAGFKEKLRERMLSGR